MPIRKHDVPEPEDEVLARLKRDMGRLSQDEITHLRKKGRLGDVLSLAVRFPNEVEEEFDALKTYLQEYRDFRDSLYRDLRDSFGSTHVNRASGIPYRMSVVVPEESARVAIMSGQGGVLFPVPKSGGERLLSTPWTWSGWKRLQEMDVVAALAQFTGIESSKGVLAFARRYGPLWLSWRSPPSIGWRARDLRPVRPVYRTRREDDWVISQPVPHDGWSNPEPFSGWFSAVQLVRGILEATARLRGSERLEDENWFELGYGANFLETAGEWMTERLERAHVAEEASWLLSEWDMRLGLVGIGKDLELGIRIPIGFFPQILMQVVTVLVGGGGYPGGVFWVFCCLLPASESAQEKTAQLLPHVCTSRGAHGPLSSPCSSRTTTK